MKCIYWNARGLANSPTRLVLKRFILQHRPDIILLSEPWMDFADFPKRWLINLNLKFFASNSRQNMLPNLWCLCRIDLDPVILSTDDQQVSFTVLEENKLFACSAIYASTNYITRRLLWNTLSCLHSQHALPWCFIGDFNSILGAHEHRGRCSPARLPIEEFQFWSDSNNFIHLPTRGVDFTWTNGRGGQRHTERRLDRVICNQSLVDLCSSISVSALNKIHSDHFPMLLDIQMSCVSFASNFKFLRMWTLHPDCKEIVKEAWSTNVIGCPMFVLNKKLKILKHKLKLWNKEVFGNVHDHVKVAEQKLHEIQEQIQVNGHSEVFLEAEKNAQKILEDALNRQELFWQEKARINWHLQGDRNTKKIHRMAKIKSSNNKTTSLQDGEHVLTEPTQIADHVVSYYKNLFCTNIVLQEQLLAEEVIPNIVTDDTNIMLTMMPSHQEIKAAIFALNKDSAPGPDGYGAYFYQFYWEIIQEDVFKAVLEFFSSGWILPGFNSNIIAILPKTNDVVSINQYRPIAMANFKFKVISKVLADRLAVIMPSIVSQEQMGFIHDRNIKDCLCIASEAANLLHNKAYGGNIAMKIDITKAFDTLEWYFLLKVLKNFGFNESFCHWIHVILQSAYLSISINGQSHGYFNCTRGVRQGDPLSPLLFCLAEDVLSRSIKKLVEDGKIERIKSSRNTYVPSHSFYADDMMIYCKGKSSSLHALKDLFHRYELASGQVISTSKSIIFSSTISQARLDNLTEILPFNTGSLPFEYLGVPIFKGKPKVSHLQPIADKIKSKLSNWKASLLSMAGRVQLVRSVIQSMLTYSISIYSWPTSLLKELEKCIRNFVWSGDSEKRKLVTVSWKRVCRPINQGGLNLRSLCNLNSATNLSLCWNMLHSQKPWAVILKDRVLRKNSTIKHHIFSSLWSSMKDEFNVIKYNTIWLLGNGKSINFWNDAWCGPPLSQSYNIPDSISALLSSTVSDYLFNNQWQIPEQLQHMFPNILKVTTSVTIPMEEREDQLLWKHSPQGTLHLKEAYSFKLQHTQELQWAKTIWSSDIPPSRSMLVWRLMHEKLPTDENLRVRGCSFPSMCSLCCRRSESSIHLFFQCPFASILWAWLSRTINLSLNFNSLEELLEVCDLSWSPQCKVVIKAAIINLFNTIWFAGNQARFNGKSISCAAAMALITSSTSLSCKNTTKATNNSIRDFTILKNFSVRTHSPKTPQQKEVIWQPPPITWLKCNIDGASKGNPGMSGCGGIFRNCQFEVVCSFVEPLGNSNSFIAELCAFMRAIAIAKHQNWHNIWIETDSTLVLTASKHPNKVP